ncbi:hypothetical protein DB346_08240 [Verrucomicrobia bacterium LW23]|nr:hypothetical protein DB346_08240 [Verrucomicrobia bacterium LW23]
MNTLEITSRIRKVLSETHNQIPSRALVVALECGKLLLEQKESLPHGEWLPWLAANTPEISDATARRYIRLAKHADQLDLTTIGTLRQAYLAIGVVAKSPTKQKASL